MEETSRTDIIPTTEHGLPLNANDSINQFNLTSFDQPIYRSICVEPPQELPQTMHRFISEPLTQVKDDLALEKVRYSKSRSNSIEHTAKQIEPLNLDDNLVLERTKFTTNGEYATIRQRLVQFLQSQRVIFENLTTGPSLKCSAFVDGTLVTFDVNIYCGGPTFTIEFQRRSGCSMLFNKLFHRSHKYFTCEDLTNEPMSTKKLVQLLHCELSPSSRNHGLQTLRRWLREDPEEASAAFTSLVQSGFLTGSDVVDLAMEICDISRLYALCSLSALACTNTVDVAKYWDKLKQCVLTAFMNGNAHVVSEACELCCHLQTQGRNFVETANRRFVDEEILSAARTRLAKDAAGAPFCMTVAVRTMFQAGDVQLNV